jgi:hypothetical protein
MTDEKSGSGENEVLLKVLTAHFNSLVSARSDEALLRKYSALLRFLKSRRGEIHESAFTKRRKNPAPSPPSFTESELRRASLDEIAKLVSDETIPRKDLEFIAIQRFSVPRGSMRSFSNRQMLVNKLLTLIANERTHQTIGEVARGQSNKP